MTGGVECRGVERAEAEAIYDQGREVGVLRRMDEQIRRLSERVASKWETDAAARELHRCVSAAPG